MGTPAAEADDAGPAGLAAVGKATTAKRGATKKATPPAQLSVALDPDVLEAIHEATAEAPSPPEPKAKAKAGGKGGKDAKDRGKGAKRRRTSTPPPAVNEPLPFINFVAAFPLGSEVEGEVASFTSHGAMVEVAVPDGGACTATSHWPDWAIRPRPRPARSSRGASGEPSCWWRWTRHAGWPSSPCRAPRHGWPAPPTAERTAGAIAAGPRVGGVPVPVSLVTSPRWSPSDAAAPRPLPLRERDRLGGPGGLGRRAVAPHR